MPENEFTESTEKYILTDRVDICDRGELLSIINTSC